jgi:glutamine amidotransferase
VAEASTARVAIVDYEMGNLFSVRHACLTAGMDPIITSEKDVILSADAAILPGVGAFGEAMASLRKMDLVSPLRDFAASGKPLMGVCLGLQLLFDESEEFGPHPGLGLVKGSVRRFPARSPANAPLRVPQIGWNRIRSPRGDAGWDGTPLQGVCQGEFMYFVHSYYVVPADAGDSLCVTDYEGIGYCSGIRRGNLFAVQFHPEKSAEEGIRIYRNFHEQTMQQRNENHVR